MLTERERDCSEMSLNYCNFVTFPFGILVQVWYLIVSIPNPWCLSCFMTEFSFWFVITIISFYIDH